MKYTIGIDLGTTNLCALLVNSETYEIERVVSTKNNTLIASDDPACFEQDATVIVQKVIGLIKGLVETATVDIDSISGIAITGQMHGIVLVDDKLVAKSPLYTWRDRRSETSGALQQILKKLPENYMQNTGCRLAAGFGGVTLAWLLGKADSSAKISELKALGIADYLAAVLTGEVGIDYSNAAGWGIFDIKNNYWSTEMLEILGIPAEMLPNVITSGRLLGEILPEIASETLLGERTKVWVPIGDNQASFYGATNGKKKTAVINIGTSGQITLPSSEVCVENGIETRPLPGGGYILVGAILCGGWSYEYLARFFGGVIQELAGVEISRDKLYESMGRLLNNKNNGNGIEVITKFSGTRDNCGEQTGSILGIDEGNLTPGNMIYGFLRGIVQELATMLPENQNNDYSWNKLVATGNAIRLNSAMLPIIEDVFGKHCVMSAVAEEAASGAAFVAINFGE